MLDNISEWRRQRRLLHTHIVLCGVSISIKITFISRYQGCHMMLIHVVSKFAIAPAYSVSNASAMPKFVSRGTTVTGGLD
jgi:hypothetical protein